MEDDGLPQARDQPGTVDRVPASRDDGAELRSRHAPPVAGGGQGDVAAHGHRRSRGGELPADRRAGQSVRHRAIARQGRADARRPHPRRRRGHRLRDGGPPHRRHPHECGAHRLRKGGAVRRPVVAANRSAGRRPRAASARQASVCDHGADGRDHARAGDGPRSRPADVLQGRGRRAGVRRLRAEPDRLDDRRRSRRLRVPAFRRRLEPFRAAHDACARPRSEPGKRRDQADDQRSGELHTRRELHPGCSTRARQFPCRVRLQRLRHRVRRRGRLGSGDVGEIRRSADGPVGRRHPAVFATARRSDVGRRAHPRGLWKALHDRVPA